MPYLSDWLLVAALVAGSALALARSELVRRRRGVPRQRRRAYAVFQTGSALLVVAMVAFENVFGLVDLGVHPVLRAATVLAAMCCTLYGYVGLRRTKAATATTG